MANPPNPPFLSGPDSYIDNTGQLIVECTITPDYSVSLGNVSCNGTLNIEIDFQKNVGYPGGQFSFPVAPPGPCINSRLNQITVVDQTTPNYIVYVLDPCVAAKLPPKNILSSYGSTHMDAPERKLILFELEMLGLLENMSTSIANHYNATFKGEMPARYTEFVAHIENAQNSLKSVVEVPE